MLNEIIIMNISDITTVLEQLAPPSLQEEYDNAGLITGNSQWECKGVLICLDATEKVIEEALEKNCNLVVAHHPIVFRGLKKINGKNYVERTVIKAIKHDIAIYAIHTNLDNIIGGVNGKIADKLGLINRQILLPKDNTLLKLAVFVPVAHKETLLQALFAAGAGKIGHYGECSFSVSGSGTFKAGPNTHPFVGTPGERHTETEDRIEVTFPAWLTNRIIAAVKANHPYEEVAYDLYNLSNAYEDTGAGLVGFLPEAMTETAFLALLKSRFNLQSLRHTDLTGKPIRKVAICGGAGSFLIENAKASKADAYVTADIKYHEFFDADGRLLLTDIGHYESEQFTTDLLFDILSKKFPNFAVLKTGINTNPVKYFS